MNKIQTTKANSTLRRFFDRLGGGNVKALGYNKTASVDGNGGDGGNTPQNLVTFPITPTKIVGYIDNTNHDAYEIDYDSWTAELKKDIISPENLMDYCKNANNGESVRCFF